MKSRPIIFSAPMVLALLAGRKTQTRRVVKVQPHASHNPQHAEPRSAGWVWIAHDDRPTYSFATGDFRCPYGAAGSHLWVRELHAVGSDGIGNPIMVSPLAGAPDNHMWGSTFTKNPVAPEGSENWCLQWKRTSPMFMPRWASRITLELTDVRVERLQDISEADAIAEGIERSGECNWRDYSDQHNDFTSARRSYRSLWEQINGPGSWDANPWVWALSFKRV